MSGVLLISTLNAGGPMPNAASVLSHSPTILALLRQPPLDERIQNQLDSTLQILEKWCDSSLESHFGFDYEMEYGPEYPSISPEIHVIDIESGSQAKQEILSLIEKIEQRERLRRAIQDQEDKALQDELITKLNAFEVNETKKN